MHNAQHFLSGALALALLVCGSACGDDGDGASGAAIPVISDVALVCGPFVGDDDPQVEGDVLLSITATVVDEDNNVAEVTATFNGAVLDMPLSEGTTYTYQQAGSANQLALCSGDEPVVIRAIDEAGNVAELRESSF